MEYKKISLFSSSSTTSLGTQSQREQAPKECYAFWNARSSSDKVPVCLLLRVVRYSASTVYAPSMLTSTDSFKFLQNVTTRTRTRTRTTTFKLLERDARVKIGLNSSSGPPHTMSISLYELYPQSFDHLLNWKRVLKSSIAYFKFRFCHRKCKRALSGNCPSLSWEHRGCENGERTWKGREKGEWEGFWVGGNINPTYW